MKTKIKAPKGWRVLPKGTIIQDGDNCFTPLHPNNGWQLSRLVGHMVGWDSNLPPAFIYIRRIKKGKK